LWRFEDEGWRVRKDGTRFWANVIITALRDKYGNLHGFGKVTRDLTERRLAEEQRLKLAREQEADTINTWQQAGFECPLSLKGLRVLVLDDEADARGLLKVILEECQAEVTTVASAAEAYKTLEGLSPDVIISNIGMPFEDGYTFMRNVRAKEAGTQSRIPAVALTAHARVEDRLRALSAGYQVHVIEPAELVAVIASLLGPKRSNN
jgi:PAS domain S-box